MGDVRKGDDWARKKSTCRKSMRQTDRYVDR